MNQAPPRPLISSQGQPSSPVLRPLATIRIEGTEESSFKWLRCAAYLPPGIITQPLYTKLGLLLVDGSLYEVQHCVTHYWDGGSAKRLVIFAHGLPRSIGFQLPIDAALVEVSPSYGALPWAQVGFTENPLSREPTGPLLGNLSMALNGAELVWQTREITGRLPGHYYMVKHAIGTKGAAGNTSLPAGYWAELHSEFVVGSPSARYVFRCGWSTPEVPQTWTDEALITQIRATGDAELGFSKLQGKRGQYDNDHLTLDLTGCNDGQSLAAEFVFTQAATNPALDHRQCLAYQVDATTYGGFGLMGRPKSLLLDDIYKARDATGQAEGIAESLLTGNWESGFGSPSESGQTGDHGEFGLVAPAGWLLWGSPQWIELAVYNFYAESCRPIWLRKANRLPYTNAETQDVVWWGERPHPSGKNMLGKDGEINPYVHGRRTTGGGIWTGSDEQHFDHFEFIAYAALTADPCAETMLSERVERWLGCLRTDTGNETVDNVGSGRAARFMGMLALATEVVSSSQQLADIKRTLDANIAKYQEQWVKDGANPAGSLLTQVMPQQVYGPSDQAGGLPCNHWRPWEDAISATALLRCYAIEGLANRSLALGLAAAFAVNIVTHGMQEMDGLDENGNKIKVYRIYTALAYQEKGVPLTPAQLADPALARDGSGAGYTRWAYAAFVVAHNAGVMIGEMQPWRRAELAVTIKKAAFCIDQIKRSKPTAFTSETCLATLEAMEDSEWLAVEVLPTPAWVR